MSDTHTPAPLKLGFLQGFINRAVNYKQNYISKDRENFICLKRLNKNLWS